MVELELADKSRKSKARFWTLLRKSKLAKAGLVLLVLNEIRGLAVVGSVAYAYFR